MRFLLVVVLALTAVFAPLSAATQPIRHQPAGVRLASAVLAS